MDKRTTAAAVVRELRDGMTIGIGGWGSRRKPMALVREILRSPLRDLTLVSYGGPDVGLLCAAGKVRRVVFGFVSLDSIPLEPHFRKAREAARWRRTSSTRACSSGACTRPRCGFHSCRRGRARLRRMKLYPGLKTVTSPYADQEELVAMPALELDVALVHANRADAKGNGQFLGPDLYFDDLLCMAARRRFLSCERIVAPGDFAKAGPVQTLRISRMFVDGVVEAPGGAHPTELPARLRPGRGLPARVRGEREESRSMAGLPARYPSRCRTRRPPGRGARAMSGFTRAEVCAVALAECFRGDGEILASAIGVLPTLGARLAKLSFAPDLLITDGLHYVLDNVPPLGAANGFEPVIEGWLPYRNVFDLLWAGRRHVLMGATQIDRYGNQNIACIGDPKRPRAQLLGMRGAPGNTINHPTSYWVPKNVPKSLLRGSMWSRESLRRAAALGSRAARCTRSARGLDGVFDSRRQAGDGLVSLIPA